MIIFNELGYQRGHPTCHPRWLPNLVLDTYTDVAIMCVLYKIVMIKMRYKEFLYL